MVIALHHYILHFGIIRRRSYPIDFWPNYMLHAFCICEINQTEHCMHFFLFWKGPTLVVSGITYHSHYLYPGRLWGNKTEFRDNLIQRTWADKSHTKSLSKMPTIVIRSSVTQSLPAAVLPGFAKVSRLQYDVAFKRHILRKAPGQKKYISNCKMPWVKFATSKLVCTNALQFYPCFYGFSIWRCMCWTCSKLGAGGWHLQDKARRMWVCDRSRRVLFLSTLFRMLEKMVVPSWSQHRPNSMEMPVQVPKYLPLCHLQYLRRWTSLRN